MKTSENGIQLIGRFEGCRLTAYQDAVKVWTIGYGHTKGVRRGQTITKAQALEFLRQDAVTAENQVMKYDSKYHWNQNQFDALVSFAFNIGNIKTLTANGTRSIAQISNAILSYNKAGGKVLKGLTTRRNAEKALFDTPCSGGVATTATKTETPKTQTSDGIKTSSLKSLQQALNADGIRDMNGKKLAEDGVYGAKTEWALKNCAFQSGSKGVTVQWIQMHLNTIAGDLLQKEGIGALNATGVFNTSTIKATVAYQKSRGLSHDGVIGRKTLLQMVKE